MIYIKTKLDYENVTHHNQINRLINNEIDLLKGIYKIIIIIMRRRTKNVN